MDVPLEAFLLPLDLEARGFHLTPGGECALVVRPYQQLTPEDFGRSADGEMALTGTARIRRPGVQLATALPA